MDKLTVTQGPEWVARWVLSPPPWANSLIYLIFGLAFAAVSYRLYQRNWKIDINTQKEMQSILGTIVMVWTATVASVNIVNQPYLVDVSVGFVAGYGTVMLPQTGVVPFEWPASLQDPVERTAIVWAFLAVAAYALPMLADVNGKGILLGTSRLVLAGLSIAIVFYNATASERLKDRREDTTNA